MLLLKNFYLARTNFIALIEKNSFLWTKIYCPQHKILVRNDSFQLSTWCFWRTFRWLANDFSLRHSLKIGRQASQRSKTSWITGYPQKPPKNPKKGGYPKKCKILQWVPTQCGSTPPQMLVFRYTATPPLLAFWGLIRGQNWPYSIDFQSIILMIF